MNKYKIIPIIQHSSVHGSRENLFNIRRCARAGNNVLNTTTHGQRRTNSCRIVRLYPVKDEYQFYTSMFG